jgi:hypothetical protein
MFYGPGMADFDGEVPVAGAVPWSWIVPGHFFRSYSSSQPPRVEASRALLYSIVQRRTLYRLVAAAPHRLSYAALSRFYYALPKPIERSWIIP